MQKCVPAEGVVCAELGGEAVLLDVGRGVYFGLDEVAYRIWTLLGEGNDADAIVARLTEEFNAEPAEIRADVAAFLDTLVERGLAGRAATAPVAG